MIYDAERSYIGARSGEGFVHTIQYPISIEALLNTEYIKYHHDLLFLCIIFVRTMMAIYELDDLQRWFWILILPWILYKTVGFDEGLRKSCAFLQWKELNMIHSLNLLCKQHNTVPYWEYSNPSESYHSTCMFVVVLVASVAPKLWLGYQSHEKIFLIRGLTIQHPERILVIFLVILIIIESMAPLEYIAQYCNTSFWKKAEKCHQYHNKVSIWLKWKVK